MKKQSGNRIMLGLFVVVGLGLFILGIFFIGQKQRLFSSTFNVKFVCTDVSGLQVGNNVRFSGITIGTVGNIEIANDTSVLVELVLDKEVKKFIKKDALAGIGSEGLMGDKIVNLSAGTAGHAPIENGDIIVCSGGNSIEEIMAQVKITAANAAIITGDLAEVIGNIKDGKGAVGKFLTDSSFANNLGATMTNLKQGTKGFEENMEAAKHNFLLKGYFKKKEKEEADSLQRLQKEKEKLEKEGKK